MTAFHIPGVQNVSADRESRIFANPNAEWMLNPKCLKQALIILNYEPEIDLFATRLNAQFAKHCSLRLDPNAYSIDAFSISWFDLKFYCFPPFSCILQVLLQVRSDSVTGVILVPKWPTKIWYPHLLSLHAVPPVYLKSSKNLLSLPGWTDMVHPLYRSLHLMVCLVSGNVSPDKAYLPPQLT